MLSRADADLVRRDPAIPALGALLDPEAFASTIRSWLPIPFDEPPRISYIRYKPGMSCLVGYEYRSGGVGDFVSATALRSDERVKLVNAGTRLGNFVLSDRAVVVKRFPHDDELPALRRLAEPQRRRRMLMKLLPDRPDLWGATIEAIRYKPNRRFVGCIRTDDNPEIVLKFYTRGAFAATINAACAFHDGSAFECPKLLGRSARRCAIAWPWQQGQLLTDLINTRIMEFASMTRVGAALAELHGQNPNSLAFRSRRSEAAALPPIAAWLGHVQPSIAVTAERLAQCLAEQLESLPAESRPIHGDFYANQVLVDRSQISFLDFDEAIRGDPACDVGTFLAHLEGNAIRGHSPAIYVAPVTAALIDGYRAVAAYKMTDERIALYTAVGLFRLATHPFRSREANWAEVTEALLRRADSLLSSATARLTVEIASACGGSL